MTAVETTRIVLQVAGRVVIDRVVDRATATALHEITAETSRETA